MKERSRTEHSILNIITGIGGYFLNTVLGFICRMVFVRCLSADYLGVNGLFTNILTILSLAELGVGNAVVFALYKPLAKHDEGKIASLVKFYGKAYRIIGLSIGILGICLLPFLNMVITEQPNISESIYFLYLLNLLNTVGTYFFSYRSSLIIAAQQNYIVSGINYIVTILQSLVQMIVLVLTKNYIAYLLIQTAGVFIYNVIISRIAVVKFPYIKSPDIKPLEEKEKKSLFQNVRDLMIYKVSGLLVNSTDNILITFFNGVAVTGITSNYTLLTTTLNSLLGQMFNGVTASVGNFNAIETKDKQLEMFNFLNLLNFWMFGWASVGIVCCSSDIVNLCFGDTYVLSIEIPLILAVNFYTVGMMNAVWTYKHTLGLFKYGRFLQLATGVINLVASIILGKFLGVLGILLASFISRLCTSFWYDPYAIHKHGFNRSVMGYYGKYVMYAVLIAFTGGLCFGICSIFAFPLIINVVLKFLVCCIVPNLIFFVFFRKTKEFVRLKGMAVSILSKMKRAFNRS